MLIGTLPISVLPAASAPFSLADLPGLDLLLDERGHLQASGGAACGDGDPVGYWTDYSGQGNHHEQTNTSKKPTHRSAKYNGLAAVQFDGSDDKMGLAFGADVSWTAFVVAAANGAAVDNKLWGANYKSRIRTATGWEWQRNEAGGGVTIGGTVTALNVITIRCNGAGSMDWALNDGSLNNFDPDDDATTEATFNVGANGVFDGWVASLVHSNQALTDQNIADAVALLKTKWGIA